MLTLIGLLNSIWSAIRLLVPLESSLLSLLPDERKKNPNLKLIFLEMILLPVNIPSGFVFFCGPISIIVWKSAWLPSRKPNPSLESVPFFIGGITEYTTDNTDGNSCGTMRPLQSKRKEKRRKMKNKRNDERICWQHREFDQAVENKKKTQALFNQFEYSTEYQLVIISVET